LQSVVEFILTPTPGAGQELYQASSGGLGFVWWGFPASLGLLSLLVVRTKEMKSWAFAGLALLGLSFLVNLIAPNLFFDRYGGLVAWIILAVCGGSALDSVAGNRRKLLLLMPLMLLICTSAVVDPVLSPQVGFGQTSLSPTTNADRLALRWMNQYARTITVISDRYSRSYLTFVRYQSGTLSSAGIGYTARDIAEIPLNSLLPQQALFIRWSGLGKTSHYGVCGSLPRTSAEETANILYSNACDILVVKATTNR
jgi:hypothetical protein